tara:strand:+ start:2636 stop:3163 length:528 start_codon:yes stop_codon:yes gene_type:complete
MANKLKITHSLDAQILTSDTEGTVAYTDYRVDGNIGQVGGSHEKSYASDKAAKFVGVVSATAATAISNAVFKGTPMVGALPSTIKAYYVKFDSYIGSSTTVTVSMVYPHGDVAGATDSGGSVTLNGGTVTKSHTLSKGDSILIPLNAEAIANCRIHSTYTENTNEASVTVAIVGD